MKIAQTKTVALGSEDYGRWQEIFRRQNEHDLITDWMWRVRRAVRNHSGFLLSSQASGGTTHPIRNTEDQCIGGGNGLFGGMLAFRCFWDTQEKKILDVENWDQERSGWKCRFGSHVCLWIHLKPWDRNSKVKIGSWKQSRAAVGAP